MKAILPQPITLLYSNIPEPDTSNGDPPEWDGETVFSIDDTTTVSETHKIYSSLASGAGFYPPDSPDQWKAVDITNRWKALDTGIEHDDVAIAYIDSQSVQASNATWEIDVSKCSCVALMNIQAETIKLSIKVDGEVVEGPYELDLANKTALTPYEWCFTPVTLKNFVLHGFAVGFSQSLLIEASSENGATVKVGAIIPGQEKYLGATQKGIENTLSGFAVDETDSFGRTMTKHGLSAKNAKMTVYTDAENIPWIESFVQRMLGVPTVFIGDNVKDINIAVEHLVKFGIIDDFKHNTTVLSGTTEYFLSIKGLT